MYEYVPCKRLEGSIQRKNRKFQKMPETMLILLYFTSCVVAERVGYFPSNPENSCKGIYKWILQPSNQKQYQKLRVVLQTSIKKKRYKLS